MRDDTIARFVADLTLSAFNPPRGMDVAAQTAQIAEMRNSVANAIPLSTTADALDHTLAAAKGRLLREARSRAWPIIREVVEAVRAELPKRETSAASLDQAEARRFEIRLEAAKRWWNKFRDVPQWCGGPDIIAALIRDKEATAHELWKAHIWVPNELRDWPNAPGARNIRPAVTREVPRVPDWAAQ